MKYLIFSDESGKWHGDEYYIRSWIRITKKEYSSLRKEFKILKKGVKELKWKIFKNKYEKLKDIFNFDFKIFITISNPNHLQRYIILKDINKVLENVLTVVENSLSINKAERKKELAEKIKLKVNNAVKESIFFPTLSVDTERTRINPKI